jgi:hypothetical protein
MLNESALIKLFDELKLSTNQYYVELYESNLELSIEELSCIVLDYLGDLSMYILLEGDAIRKCSHCDKWQKADTKSEFEECFDIHGYYPSSGSSILPSDSYYYCIFCLESNFVDTENYYDQIKKDRLKYENYKLTKKIYIFDESSLSYLDDKKKADFHQDDIYVSWRKFDQKAPDDLLSYNQILINYDSISFFQDVIDDDEDELYKYDIYMPYIIYRKKYKCL